ncbi:acrEF/envCD operon transcriptional regulator [Leclercia adecarboxylata]|uniref:acrEF/envCD operon transcriptional regulator n=1 Tax=Leclercia adecarboxylata TaxID=83655 RepID=UPI00111B615C|nr:acrEF/envCD operon transcriptional regulator [Leclercia adecarboxylata]QCZ26818.1 acrEF/envCD operon transcriptional regulator [Leclercia adecarboxylata]
MARKTKAEAQKTRQLLIEAAIEQFAARGVASTTLTDIADAACLTRGAVYWHFTSKAEIFNAIWQEQRPLREIIHARLSQVEQSDPLLILREQFVTALQYIARDRRQRALLQILYHKCEFDRGMILESQIRERIGFNYENVREMLQQCIILGSVSAEINIDTTLIVFHGFFSGLIKNWLMNPERVDLYQQAPELVDNIFSTLPVAHRPHRLYDAAS